MPAANLVIAHGGGPTAVLNASLFGVVREAMRRDEIAGVYGARFGTQGLIDGDFVDLRRESSEFIQALPHTPGSVLGSSRRKIESADYDRILENLRAAGVRYLLINGGNGSMFAAGQLADRAPELRVIGIPKTVDNDLEGTDHCPGYGSAGRYFAVSALELGRDNEALPFPVNIFEIMGRNTGWLAASSVLAAQSKEDGPQLVYVPEIPFDSQRFLSDVEQVYRRLGRAVVAVAEGLRDARNEPVHFTSHETDRDGFGRPVPGNVSVHLAALIARELRLRVRNDKPGICGRASAAHVSNVDREEAIGCGEAAVRHAVAGMTGVMVTLVRPTGTPYRIAFGTVPFNQVACRERALLREFINSDGNYPTPAFFEYAGPLIGDGLPDYPSLSSYTHAR